VNKRRALGTGGRRASCGAPLNTKEAGVNGRRALGLGLYTTLPSPILYGINRGVGGGSVYCAMVVQKCCNRIGLAGGRGQ